MKGYSSLVTPLTDNLDTLSIEEGAMVGIEADITVDKILFTENTHTACSLIVKQGFMLTVSSLGMNPSFYDEKYLTLCHAIPSFNNPDRKDF